MKLNRALIIFVLTGLLSGATMAAQAETHIFFGIGNGVPVVTARYAPRCPGPGYVWVAGYYSGPYWISGRWVRRGDDDGYYAPRYYGRRYYRYDHDRRWRRDDGWRDHGWRRNDDRHDRGWHRGWRHGRDHHDH